MAVTTDVAEGPQFKLASVTLPGAGAAEDPMLRAAAFKIGDVANWRAIQQGITRMKKPLLCLGYQDSSVMPKRHLNDETKQLDLELSTQLGPQYHFGQISFVGLAPDLEEKARKLWQLQSGDFYDSFYVYDFAGTFFTATGFGTCSSRPKHNPLPIMWPTSPSPSRAK